MSFFGDFLRKRRLSEHQTMLYIGNLINLSRQSIQKAETGKAYLQDKAIKKIANSLNISYRELIIRKYLDKIQKSFPEVSDKDLEKCLQILMNY